jgi:competence protein ComEA
MKPTWVRAIIDGWNAEVAWTDTEIEHLCDLLLAICDMNGGVVYPDVILPEEQVSDYRRKRVEAVLSAFVVRIARRLFDRPVPVCRTEATGFQVMLPFLQATGHAPRTNLNLANAEALAALPGLGPKTAARLVAYRRAHGPIRTLTELGKIAGISTEGIEKIAPKAYLRVPSESIALRSEQARKLIDDPTFPNYIALLKTGHVLATKYSRGAKDLKSLIIAEIEGIKTELENGPRLHRMSPGIRASRIRTRDEQDAEFDQYVAQFAIKGTHAVLLRDATYFYFVKKLLMTASKSIRIVMFFFRFDEKEKEKYPTYEYLMALVEAKSKGVDVKVILDHQAEGDSKPSTLINTNALEFLRKHGVPVTFDIEDVATHSKLVLVDDAHVVVGSHNWTAGSFFAYHDVSIYVHSAKLFETYTQHFDSLWQRYEGAPDAAPVQTATGGAQQASSYSKDALR